MTGRVKLQIISKYIKYLKQPDAKSLQEAIKQMSNHQAHYIFKIHWLAEPIDAKNMRHSSVKFINSNHPMIIKFRQNIQIQMYHKTHSKNYGILSMCQTWIKEIQSGNKYCSFQKPINKIMRRNSKCVKRVLTTPQRQQLQQLNIQNITVKE